MQATPKLLPRICQRTVRRQLYLIFYVGEQTKPPEPRIEKGFASAESPPAWRSRMSAGRFILLTEDAQCALYFTSWRSRRESNADTRIRNPLLYPFELREHWTRVKVAMAWGSRKFIGKMHHGGVAGSMSSSAAHTRQGADMECGGRAERRHRSFGGGLRKVTVADCPKAPSPADDRYQ